MDCMTYNIFHSMANNYYSVDILHSNPNPMDVHHGIYASCSNHNNDTFSKEDYTLKKSHNNNYNIDSNYLFLGNIYPLIKVNENPNKIDFNGTEFITSIENQDKFKSSLKSWYKVKFKEVAIPRLNYFSDKYNLKINQVRFKNQKTLWGSCSSKNNINLNYLLVMAPMIVIDYVIIHELVHTVHKNHSANFWNAVEAIMPDYKKAKKWLNKNGYKLRNL